MTLQRAEWGIGADISQLCGIWGDAQWSAQTLFKWHIYCQPHWRGWGFSAARRGQILWIYLGKHWRLFLLQLPSAEFHGKCWKRPQHFSWPFVFSRTNPSRNWSPGCHSGQYFCFVRGLPHWDGEEPFLQEGGMLSLPVALRFPSCVSHPQLFPGMTSPRAVTCSSLGPPALTPSLSSCPQLQFRKISLTLESFSLDYPVVHWIKPNNNILLEKKNPTFKPKTS